MAIGRMYGRGRLCHGLHDLLWAVVTRRLFHLILVLSPDLDYIMGQYFKVVDFDLLQGLYSMGKLGENVTNPFETVVRMICEVDIPPSPVAAVKAPRRLTSGSHDPLTYALDSVLL